MEQEPNTIGELAEQMRSLGVHQVRYYVAGRFSVELHDGRKGVGRGVMAAIKNARAEQPAKVAA